MSKIQVFGYFLGNWSLKITNIFHDGKGDRGDHLSVVQYWRKILIRGLRGINCQNLGFLDIFSETGH